MKRYISITIFAVTLIFPVLAFGQWDYNSHAIDNIIESRIDRRKTRERIRARKGGRRAASRKATVAAKNGASPAKTAARSTPQFLSFHRDTYQNFHLDDKNGYQVNFSFIDAGSGKVISKSHNFTYHRSVAEFDGVPAGIYTVKAEALYNGKIYPVYLGSEDGSSMNPKGGNFAPSIKIEIKRQADNQGTMVLKTFPETLHIRVID